MRSVELLRHPDNDGDRLSLGRGGCRRENRPHQPAPPYEFFASTGAARAVQTAEILRRAAAQDDPPILTASGLRSNVEDRSREAAKAAGDGAE
jgi:hypothetical protein